MSKILKWWDSRSLTFSHLCDEEFTHGQVVVTHLAIVLLLIACIIADTI